MSKFQIILIGVFGFFILAGVGIFAFYRSSNSVQSQVVIWGTMPQENFFSIFSNLAIAKDRTLAVTYQYKPESTFDKNFVEALASGVGPDIIFLNQDSILAQRNKLLTVPYSSYPLRTFKDTYIEEGELFLDAGGVTAFPVTVDPLMMYWNRDIFSSQGVAQPPRFWDEFFELSKQFTRKDGALNISRATVPLGEYANITNAKELISTLIMQAGSAIVIRDQSGYRATLADNTENPVNPTISALNFYTDFSNPTKTHYSWNRSLPNSQLMFTSGDLAVYFGFASELQLLKIKNPNLNFDVAAMPQSRSGHTKITFGVMQGLAITKNTRNAAASFAVISGLSTPEALTVFAQTQGLPPVRRDLISRGNANPNQALFYQSALISRAWYDPNRVTTNGIFRNAVESITGGRARPSESVQRMQQEFYQLLQGAN